MPKSLVTSPSGAFNMLCDSVQLANRKGHGNSKNMHGVGKGNH